MFNLQGSELIIILLLALVVLGPEKLPDAMRKAGQFYAELKKMSTGFQSEFRAVVDEPLREIKDTANTIRDSADFTNLQAGERPEKPKSAEMLAAADAEATPTTDLPFAEHDAAAAGVVAAGSASVDDDVPDVGDPPRDPDQVAAGRTPMPAPPAPFSSSQAFSAAPSSPPDVQSEGGASVDGSAPTGEAERPTPYSTAQMSSAAPRAATDEPATPPAAGTEDATVEPADDDDARSDDASEEHTE